MVLGLAALALPASGQDRVEQARVVFEQGETDYNAGAYALALRRFQRAYELLEGHPRRFMALFNIGRCYEELGRLEDARDAYERFLAEGGRDSMLRATLHEGAGAISAQRA